jgi:alkylation response protein AidB-like acyl-CoA dehydrogenase
VLVFGVCWPEEYGGTPPPGGFDIFHDLIYWDELARYGGGWLAACFLTINIALPPILAVGSEYLRQKVARPTIEGKKIICLCVTEPYAGSDVANIRTTARSEGDYYIVSGEKKYITSGMKADFFTVAVRTGEPGMGGISLLLLEKGMPGITCRKLSTQGWASSNTAYITFDDVKVPKKNLIGEENQGFLAIMLNFNHERFAGIAMSIRGARMCVEEAIKYARTRQTFGKRLIDHQVIRHKIAEMVRRVESSHAWLEQVAYQMERGVDPRIVGGSTALLKVQATTILEFCAREASQVLGGASCLRTGIGAKVERIYRDVRIAAIGGGSEEVMRDLAMRQARL